MNLTLPVKQSPKVPSICRVEAVLMMGIDKRVKETQNHNTILKTLQEYTGDQVVKQAVSWC